MNYPRKNLIYLKQVYTFQSHQRKFKNPKSSLSLRRFIVHFLTTEETKSQIKAHLLCFANSYFYNYIISPRVLRQNCLLRNLRKKKDTIITKPDKGNRAAILDWKLYNNTIEEIISDTSKFEKLSEVPTLKQPSLGRFLCKLK